LLIYIKTQLFLQENPLIILYFKSIPLVCQVDLQ
jgi:hypothetical protein